MRPKTFAGPSFRKTLKEMSTEQLQHRLLNHMIWVVLAVLFMFVSVFIFAPKVGYLFSFISKNRYMKENDSRAPTIPSFYNVVEATNQKNIEIKGYAEPGATVKIFINGPEKASAITDTEGVFTFTNLELNDGRNTIFARAVDSEGNESEKSENINIDYDTVAPTLEIIEPKDDATIRNLDGRVLVKGKLNEKGTVKVNGNTAVVKGDFTFEILIGVKEGDVEITIEAADMAGNKKEEKIDVKYVKGGGAGNSTNTTTPPPPTNDDSDDD